MVLPFALLLAHAAAPASALEEEVVREVNALRRSPSAYTRILTEIRTTYRGLMRELPGGHSLRTREGPAAVDEAIAALRRSAPAPALKPSPALAEAAREFARRQGYLGQIGHERMPARATRGFSGWAQNLSYGPPEARTVVAEQVVDDGVPDRGHRRNLLDPRFTHIGVGCAPHRVYGQVCVINLGAE
jgi:uncharacterized protein YkwD